MKKVLDCWFCPLYLLVGLYRLLQARVRATLRRVSYRDRHMRVVATKILQIISKIFIGIPVPLIPGHGSPIIRWLHGIFMVFRSIHTGMSYPLLETMAIICIEICRSPAIKFTCRFKHRSIHEFKFSYHLHGIFDHPHSCRLILLRGVCFASGQR
jgi:hypothetical protein